MFKILTILATLPGWARGGFTAIKALLRRGRGAAIAGAAGTSVVLPGLSWADRFWSAFFKIFLITEITEWFVSLLSKAGGLALLGFGKMAPDLALELVTKVAGEVTELNTLTVGLASETLRQITGVNADTDELITIAGGPPGRGFVTGIGDAFMPVVTDIFDVELARQDHSTRTSNLGALANVSAFFGTNLTFQLRSLTIGTVASLSGLRSLRHLEGLHQTINWAFGFGWLSWAVMSEWMNVTVNAGLRRELNSRVLPNDLSESEAFTAHLSGRIDRDLFDRILSNLGLRFDVRDLLLDIREPDLSETDVRDLLWRGEVDENFVFDYFRSKGFRPERARKKQTLLIGDRRWRIEDRITDLMERQFRDCALDERTLRLRLGVMNFTAVEEDLKIQELTLERHLRRFLSMTQNFKALDAGLKGEPGVREDLKCQGLTDLDIDVLFGLDRGAVQRRPRMRVFSVSPGRVKQGEQIEVRWAVDDADVDGVELLPQPGRVAAVGSFITTIDQNTTFEIRATNDVGTTSRQDAVIVTGPPPDPKLPTASLSVRPGTIEIGLLGTQVEVEWRVSNADTVVITPELGTVPLSGSRVLRLNTTRTFRLVATNADGETVRENTVIAEVPDFNVPDVENAPRVRQFSIRPSTVDPGDPVEIRWNVEDVDTVEIQPAIGEVGPFGTIFPAVTQTTTFTLRATNEEGETVRQRSVIVRPLPAPEPEAPPPAPRLSFNIRPGTADPGQEVVLEWNATNAEDVVIEGVPGIQIPSGAFFRRFERSEVVGAIARGPGGETRRTASIIIRPPSPPPEPDEPAAPTARLSIRPSTSVPGREVAIEWESANADQITITPELGTVGEQGSVVVTPLTTTTYTLEATGPGGTVREIRTLLVRQPPEEEPGPEPRPPSISFSVRPATIDPGDEVEITWRTERANIVNILPGIGNVQTTGTIIRTISANTIFTLTAAGPGGTTTRQDTVLVRPPASPPAPADPPRLTARISVRPGTADPGDQLEVSWVVTNATFVNIEPIIGEVEQVGTRVLSVNDTTTFTLSADGPGGRIERQDTVLIRPEELEQDEP